MTRINSAIPVRCLTDEHLLAEHREIKRLPYCLDKAIKSGSIRKIPHKFKLGSGHVLFFLDKQCFVHSRYLEIHNELIKRGFNTTDFSDNWNVLMSGYYWNDYEPTDEEYQLLIERITERINNSTKKSWHYYGEQINSSKAIELLSKNHQT